MKAVVVYESHWGNTAAIAQAIAEGIGPGARALTTDEATEPVVEAADLVVAGAPVIAFGLLGDRTLRGLEQASASASVPADLSHPPLREWLEGLDRRRARPAAAFETRIWWSPRGATGTIERGLAKAGYRIVAKAEKFVVTGGEGPLGDGELDRARDWGRHLAERARASSPLTSAA